MLILNYVPDGPSYLAKVGFEPLTFGLEVCRFNHCTIGVVEHKTLCIGLKTQKSSPQTKQSPAKTMSYLAKLR